VSTAARDVAARDKLGGFHYWSNAGIFTHKSVTTTIIVAAAVIQMIMTPPSFPRFSFPVLDDIRNTRHHGQPVSYFTPLNALNVGTSA